MSQGPCPPYTLVHWLTQSPMGPLRETWLCTASLSLQLACMASTPELPAPAERWSWLVAHIHCLRCLQGWPTAFSHPSGPAGLAACPPLLLPAPLSTASSAQSAHCGPSLVGALQIDYLLRLLAPLARTFGAGDLPPTLCAALQRGSAEAVFAAGPAAGWVPCLHPLGLCAAF